MQSEIIGQVTDVQGRQVTSGTIFDVTINGQKVSTFKAPIAEKANALKGQNVKATVNVTPWQKGEKSGTNYTLLDIEPSGQAPQAGIPIASPQNGSQGLTGASQPDERQQNIVKQSSLKIAFGYAGAAGLSEEEAFALAQRVYASVMGAQTLDEAIQQNGLEAAVAPATVVDDIRW
jgi:hypothetical protein